MRLIQHTSLLVVFLNVKHRTSGMELSFGNDSLHIKTLTYLVKGYTYSICIYSVLLIVLLSVEHSELYNVHV